MTFNEALQKLNIEDYGERIVNSNSHGERFHLLDYIAIAKFVEDEEITWFRHWLEFIIKQAEIKWARPESVFQHLPRLLQETLKEIADS